LLQDVPNRYDIDSTVKAWFTDNDWRIMIGREGEYCTRASYATFQ